MHNKKCITSALMILFWVLVAEKNLTPNLHRFFEEQISQPGAKGRNKETE